MKYKLVRRFTTAWEKMSKKYENESRKFPTRFITTPQVAFHGTRQGNVPNIGKEVSVGLKLYQLQDLSTLSFM